MTRLLLIRHGESEANRNGIFAGQIDPDLVENGVTQAKCTAKYVSLNYNVDKIYSSDLKRAYNTAKALSEETGIDVTKKTELREIKGGEWENKRFSELETLSPEAYSIWITDIGKSCCPGGESVRQLGKRIMAALEEIAKENDGKTVAIATHATPIRVAQTIIMTGDVAEMQNVPWVSNASVSVFEYDSGKWNVVSVSYDAHLDGIKSFLPTNV